MREHPICDKNLVHQVFEEGKLVPQPRPLKHKKKLIIKRKKGKIVDIKTSAAEVVSPDVESRGSH